MEDKTTESVERETFFPECEATSVDGNYVRGQLCVVHPAEGEPYTAIDVKDSSENFTPVKIDVNTMKRIIYPPKSDSGGVLHPWTYNPKKPIK